MSVFKRKRIRVHGLMIVSKSDICLETLFEEYTFLKESHLLLQFLNCFSPFRAEELFAAAIKSSVVNIGVSRSHSFVPGQKSDDQQEETKLEVSETEEQEKSAREVLPLTPQSLIGSPSIPDSSFKKINKRILVELMKGMDVR